MIIALHQKNDTAAPEGTFSSTAKPLFPPGLVEIVLKIECAKVPKVAILHVAETAKWHVKLAPKGRAQEQEEKEEEAEEEPRCATLCEGNAAINTLRNCDS